MIQFEIPMTSGLLKSEGNIAQHWTKKSKRHKQQQFLTKLYFAQYHHLVKLPVSIRMVRISPRTLDFDNLVYSLKWVRDALADSLISGLAPGRADGDDRIKWNYGQEKGKPKEYALRIEIISNG
jgi:hypothetical protein